MRITRTSHRNQNPTLRAVARSAGRMAGASCCTLQPRASASPLPRVHPASVKSARGERAVARASLEPGNLVLVVGATGGVGQLVCAKLVDRGFYVRALTRDAAKARERLGGDVERLEVAVGDTRDPGSLPSALDGVAAVVCSSGTTAFPSERWKGGNGPKETDLEGTTNLVRACAGRPGLGRFVLVTSCGVERYKVLGPFMILNAFGVLEYKKRSEEALVASGIPYTIIRPSRLTDGPYTSYDLNTLLRATSGSNQRVQLSARDDLGRGQCSRIAVAEACVQALSGPETEGKVLAMETVEGSGPGSDPAQWRALFQTALD